MFVMKAAIVIGLTLLVSFDTAHAEKGKQIQLSGVGLEGPSQSWALLSIGGAKDELFFEGDEVPGAGKLIKVEKRCVYFSQPSSESNSICFAASAQGTEDTPLSKKDKDPLIGEGLLYDLTTSRRAWLGDGKGRPAYSHMGKHSGFFLESVGKDSFLKRLGLQEGDLITSVNEVPIRSLQDMFLAAPNLNGQMIEVGFQRGNVSKGVAIRLNEELLNKLKNISGSAR